MNLNFIWIIIFTFLFHIKSYAFEITSYVIKQICFQDPYGKCHEVTVAFDDLNRSGKVRCVIKKDGKPVAMKDMYIRGVGTIEITTPNIRGTTASCQTLN